MRRKYRLAMLDDVTLHEVFHIRLSGLGTFSFLTLVFVAILVALSLLVVYTPIRNILPGYSESLRQQLIEESARVDSLQTDLTLQRQYLDVIKQLTAGDIKSDSVQSLDSLQIVQRTQLLEERSEVTDAFMAQFEQKERDQLQLFDVQTPPTTQRLCRPVRGVVVQHADAARQQYTVGIRTGKNENVLSVLRGTVVYASPQVDNTYTIIVQHQQYVSIYKQVSRVLKSVGARVEAGESIGLMTDEQEILFELWRNGQPENPEELIVW